MQAFIFAFRARSDPKNGLGDTVAPSAGRQTYEQEAFKTKTDLIPAPGRQPRL